MEMLTPESNIPFLVFDNIASDDSQIEMINDEIKYIDRFINLSPNDTESAVDQNGMPEKSNKGLWLNRFYGDCAYSPIINAMNKILQPDVRDCILDHDNAFYSYSKIQEQYFYDGHLHNGFLISKYEDGDFYKPHYDTSIFTAVLWWWNEPKQFEGGEFYFTDPKSGEEVEVEGKSNRLILFPSVVTHGVRQIKYLTPDANPRYAVTMFLTYK